MEDSIIPQTARDQIQSAYRQFLSDKGFKPRRSQREMIAEVSRTFADPAPTCVAAMIEAGTGTGKTLAYLLPGIVLAQQLQKTLVVTTATVALQEQLIQKDVPEVLSALGLSLKVGLAKGRRRYLCLIKLDQLLDGREDVARIPPLFPDEMPPGGAMGEPKLRELLDAYMEKRWDGDRDHWPEEFEESDWRALSTDRAGCTNRHCRFFKACAFFSGRAELAQADIIVANHDLLLSNRMINGETLPEPETSLLVIDEAHHFLDKARDHHGQGVGLGGLASALEALPKVLEAYHACAEEGQWLSAIAAHEQKRQLETQVEVALDALARLRRALSELIHPEEARSGSLDSKGRAPGLRWSREHRLKHGEHPEALIELFSAWPVSFSAIHQLLDDVRTSSELQLGAVSLVLQSQLEQLLAALGQFMSRLEAAISLARTYIYAAEAPEVPVARWAREVGTELFVAATPVSVASDLQAQFWAPEARVVLTSATLSSAGRFDVLQRDLGLPDTTLTAIHQSPFDYQNKACLRIPKMQSSASDLNAHTEEVAALMPSLLMDSPSALVLCTSWRQLDAVVEALPEELRAQCLIQGEHTKSEMLKTHRQAIDQGQASYILGLSSFAEGIDLPGPYCEHVILCKLPFAVPDDPMGATLGEWFEAQGLDAFMEYTLPMAAVRLAQAAGRLIRSENDQGVLTILDNRLKTKRYGRTLIRAMPPFKLVEA